jgi:HAD superfamily hydrolase (TIGR01490 family)
MRGEEERPFAVFDIDGTLVRWQLYHALVNSLIKNGFTDEALYPLIHESRMTWKNRKHSEAFKEYELELVKLYDNSLKHLKVADFDRVVNDVFEEYKDQVYVYTRELIKKLKNQGYLLFAISGSQTEVIEKIAKYYKFDDYVGRIEHRKEDRFTGTSSTPIFNKDAVLEKLVANHNVNFKGSLAVGDSMSDSKMLELVEQPIAFNPEKKLFDYARQKKWKIVVERKNMIYELESQDGKYELVKTT